MVSWNPVATIDSSPPSALPQESYHALLSIRVCYARPLERHDDHARSCAPLVQQSKVQSIYSSFTSFCTSAAVRSGDVRPSFEPVALRHSSVITDLSSGLMDGNIAVLSLYSAHLYRLHAEAARWTREGQSWSRHMVGLRIHE